VGRVREELTFAWAETDGTGDLVEAVANAEKEIGAPASSHASRIPPNAVLGIIDMLGVTGLNEGSKIICEKPFGVDLASARHLNAAIDKCFDESNVFRIDHFLVRSQSTTSSRCGSQRALRTDLESYHVSYVQMTCREDLH